MKCPNCNSNVTKNVCRHCGLDLTLYNKSVKVSLVLYNKGLELANRRQLSDAVDTLIRSVEFDKRNTMARNLLGLCYFECGKTNEALKEWVISSSYNKVENLADYYLEIFQQNNRLIQKYDDSAHMYNEAIADLYQKSEDIAIIQLKKAIEYNPNFIDALNLLCLCYINLKDKQKAGGCIDKVLEIDVNNKTALSYYRELYSAGRSASVLDLKTKLDFKSQDTPREKTKGGTREKLNDVVLSGIDLKKMLDRAFMTGIPASLFVSFAIGVLCTLAVVYTLIIPSATNKYKNDTAELNAAIEKKDSDYDSMVKQKDDRIAALTRELNDKEVENAKLLDDINIQSKVQKIDTAYGFLLQSEPENALNYLGTIETEGLPPEAIELYNYINQTARPLIEADYYSQGVAAYNAKKYDEAKICFEKSVDYAVTDSPTLGDAFYFLGRVAEFASDNDTARLYYENVINNYKNAKYYNQATTRLASLSNR